MLNFILSTIASISLFLADGNGGLNGILTTFVNDWAMPVFIIILIIVLVPMIKEREFRKLALTIVIAAIIGALIVGAKTWFSEGGSLNNVATNIVNQIDGGKSGTSSSKGNTIIRSQFIKDVLSLVK